MKYFHPNLDSRFLQIALWTDYPWITPICIACECPSAELRQFVPRRSSSVNQKLCCYSLLACVLLQLSKLT